MYLFTKVNIKGIPGAERPISSLYMEKNDNDIYNEFIDYMTSGSSKDTRVYSRGEDPSIKLNALDRYDAFHDFYIDKLRIGRKDVPGKNKALAALRIMRIHIFS